MGQLPPRKDEGRRLTRLQRDNELNRTLEMRDKDREDDGQDRKNERRRHSDASTNTEGCCRASRVSELKEDTDQRDAWIGEEDHSRLAPEDSNPNLRRGSGPRRRTAP